MVRAEERKEMKWGREDGDPGFSVGRIRWRERGWGLSEKEVN